MYGPGGRRGVDFIVQQHRVVPEHDVFGSEVITV